MIEVESDESRSKSVEKWKTGSVLPESFITLSLSKGMEENPTGPDRCSNVVSKQRKPHKFMKAALYRRGFLRLSIIVRRT